ncbi:MAG: Zn-dependent protease with chaperone function [Frankiales bacterium]|nr:Zn-dependent protease with chaperone function [Frankiales bacterium]
MSRIAVAGTLAALFLGFAVALVATVPWTVLPGAAPTVQVSRDFTPAEITREQAYHREVRPPAYAALLLGLAVAGLLALTPVGARVVAAVARPLGGGWGWQVLLGTLALTLIGRVVTLPLDAWSERVLRRYGLSTQSWSSWFVDAAKSVALTAGLSGIVLLAVLALVRLAPRTWWAWAALVTAGFVVAGSFVYPLVVEPVFNRFTPLAAGHLRTDLLALAARDGVPVEDVLVADASRRTTALNAYVSGFGSTRRIVLYDTLVQQASPEEVRLVVAHELGHAKRQDVLHGTLIGALGAAAGVCALALLLSWTPLLRRAGADSIGDPRVIPLLLFLVAAGTLVLAPLSTLVSRRIEARADVHSLDLTRDVPTFVASEQRLARTNLADLEPNPVLYAFFATHPSTPQRIALAREWARLHP